MVEKLRVGVVTSPHGVRGEAKVYPTTDDPKRFSKLKKVHMKSMREAKELEIESVKYFKNMVICKFKGIDTPEEVAKYKNADLFVDRKDATPLKKNENYIADLIGLLVVTDKGKELGVVEDIFPTGANQVMEVKMEKKNVLIPYIKECILDVDLENQKIVVHLLKGLLDL